MIENKELEIVTICGSIKFKKEMMEIAVKLTLEGKIVFTPMFSYEDSTPPTSFEKEMFTKIHREKIKLSDSIFVVNVDNYIGDSTNSEIQFAKDNNKKIKYLVE